MNNTELRQYVNSIIHQKYNIGLKPLISRLQQQDQFDPWIELILFLRSHARFSTKVVDQSNLILTAVRAKFVGQVAVPFVIAQMKKQMSEEIRRHVVDEVFRIEKDECEQHGEYLDRLKQKHLTENPNTVAFVTIDSDGHVTKVDAG